MAVRNAHLESVPNFIGLNTLQNATNLKPNEWFESSNMIVGSSGTALALRSPRGWNTDPSITSVLSAFSWNRYPGVTFSLVIYEEVSGAVSNQYQTNAGANTFIQTVAAPSNQRSTWVGINGRAFFVNGYLCGQIITDNSLVIRAYAIGINPPAAAPTVSIVGGGALTLNVGVTASYAYRNSVTSHVGQCSAASANSGAGTTTLRVHTVASAQTGVDGIVIFLTSDGGNIRYLVVDANGAPIVYANATANVDFTAAYLLDTNTTETSFNVVPWATAGATNGPNYCWVHQDRIFMCGFGSTRQTQIIYSGIESVGIGVPTESYPPLNIVTIPGQSEPAIGGISTTVGNLIFSDRNAYLLSGQLTDTVISAQNVSQASYRLDSLQWGLGTRSPLTIKVTPYGVIWLDQSKRLQMWSFSGFPVEVGLALRNELKAILDTTAARSMAEATWFQYGEQAYYVLTASTTGTKNNKLFILSFAQDSETKQYQMTSAVSDIAAQSIISHIDNVGFGYCLTVRPSTGQLRFILNFDIQGDGWDTAQSLYFGVVTGNFSNNTNWNTVQSLRYDSQVADVLVQTRNFDDSEVEALNPELQANENQTLQAVVNRYGVHKKIRFTFPKDDTKRREIQNLRITYSGKSRP